MPLKLVERPNTFQREFTFSISPPPASPPETSASLAEHPRPPANFLPERDMHMFGTYPLKGAGEPGRGLVKCTRCHKPVMEWVVGEHKRICNHVLDGVPLTIKKTVKGDKSLKFKSDDVGGKKRRASEVSDSISPSPTKKRAKLPNGSDDEDDLVLSGKGIKKRETKKMQKEREKAERREAKERERMEIAERKKLRAAEPVNYDRQCGVINDKGLPCSRSLTCKTHTVGAKRAVEGRTRTYDSLYLDWQRTNNPNFREPQPKRDKDSIRKDKRSSGSGSGAGDGVDGNIGNGVGGSVIKKSGGKKKLRNGFGSGYGPNDEKGLEDDEDGQREMEELIRATKISGERCKFRINFLGTKGSSTTTTTTSNTNNNNSNNNMTTNGNGNANSQRPQLNRGQSSTSTSSSSTFPHFSIWRSSSHHDQISVGDLLSKALAARSKPIPLAQQNNLAMPPPGMVGRSMQGMNGGNGNLDIHNPGSNSDGFGIQPGYSSVAA